MMDEQALTSRSDMGTDDQSVTGRYRQLVETLRYGLVEADPAGRVELCNRAACQILQSTPGELIGRFLWECVPTNRDQAEAKRQFQALLRTQPVPSCFVTQMQKSDGSQIDLQLDWNYVRSSSGQMTGIMIVLTDITVQKQHEGRLRRYAEKLEEMVQSRTQQVVELEREKTVNERLAATGRLAARIAHEVNNPLAGIKNSFLLVKGAIPQDHPYYSYVGRIEREIERITKIMRQMFDLYRPEREQPQKFVISETVQDVVAMLQTGREDQVKIQVKMPPESITVVLPENALRQVLFNILQNAIEASPAAGNVTVAMVMGDQVVISVADDGPGIPEDNRAKVFEPFFSTKTGMQRAGLGLGLSVCKSLVESMGGTIDFQSRPGRGTVFYLTFPTGV